MPTVLVVDDEPVLLRVMARFLEKPDRTLILAASAGEALEAARGRGPIDVALLDKNLGDRSGLELARDLRRLDPLTAIILITGYASVESAIEAVQIGAYDYVTKPVDDFDGLALKITNAAEKVSLARDHERILARLAESEERYRKLFDAAPDAILLTGLDGRVCEVNPAAAAMFDRDRTDLIGSEVSQLFRTPLPAPEAWSEGCIHADAIRRDATFGADVTPGEAHLGGRAMRMLTVRDVSARERLEAECRAVEDELRHAQKMDAIGRLAGGIAHDLGSVLTVAVCSLEQISSRCSPALSGDVDVLRTAVERGSALVRQMMTLTRKASTSPVLLSPSRGVEDVAKLLRTSTGDRVALVIDARPDAWPIRIDPTHLGQVLLNLAMNARDAMPEGGTLRIAVENCPANDPGGTGASTDGERVVLTVSDTGVGMTPEIQERIFEPFFTTKEPGRGTGLGLAVAYGIVKQAGGTIAVESEPGRGTTFRIAFPRAGGEASTTPDVVQPAAAPARRGRVAMVVEDSAPLRSAMARALAGIGVRVLEFGSAEEALRAIRGDDHELALLVTDLLLPGMAGTDLAAAVRCAHPACAVILVTSAPGDARVEAFMRGGGRVLLKPFRMAGLVDVARLVVSAASRTAQRHGPTRAAITG